MKSERLTWIVNTLISATLGLCGIGCISTAFDLDASSLLSVLVCLLFAAAPCLCLKKRRGWLVLPAAAVIGAVWLFRFDGLSQLGSLLYALMKGYNTAYGWAIPDFLSANRSAIPSAFAFIGGFISFHIALSLTARSTGSAVLWGMLPLIPCFIVTDTVPSAGWLMLTLACICLLALTGSVRKHNSAAQASRLTALLLVPVLLANWLLLCRTPQDDYVFPSELLSGNFVEKIVDRFSDILEVEGSNPVVPGGQGGTATEKQILLREVGPQQLSSVPVMAVQTDFSGTIYLRGKSYYSYDGESWTEGGGEEQDFSIAEDFRSSELENVSIVTRMIEDVTYLPYYPAQQITLKNGELTNTELRKTFSHQMYALRADWVEIWASRYTLADLQEQISGYEAYLQLPATTKTGAASILADLGLEQDTDVVAAAEEIAAYVRNSATYSLNTPAMPDRAQDFALWFLESSETGYCIHFASAATVLLRAAGIPARYVIGYAAPVSAGLENSVTGQMAHAWTEYYLPEVGWVVLDATPSSPDVPTPDPSIPSTSTGPTQPSTGTEPTQTTSPSIPSTGESSTPSSSQRDPSSADTTGGGTDPGADYAWLVRLMCVLLAVFTAIGLVLLQWRLRLYLRYRRMHEGTTNARALHCWRQTVRLAKLCHQAAPETLHGLAQKAKFSQHTITEEELGQFADYFHICLCHLKKQPFYKRLVYRIVFAVY